MCARRAGAVGAACVFTRDQSTTPCRTWSIVCSSTLPSRMSSKRLFTYVSIPSELSHMRNARSSRESPPSSSGSSSISLRS